MKANCLKCNNLLDIVLTDLCGPPVVTCPNCNTAFQAVIRMELREVRIEDLENGQSGDGQAMDVANVQYDHEKLGLRNRKVAISITGLATREVLRDILSFNGLETCTVDADSDMVAYLVSADPALVILDVDTLTQYGTDIIEQLKNQVKGEVRVVLIASIHKEGRYRREPDNLFGADCYIERYELRDCLVEKIMNDLDDVVQKKSSKILEITSPVSEDFIIADMSEKAADTPEKTIEKTADISEEVVEKTVCGTAGTVLDTEQKMDTAALVRDVPASVKAPLVVPAPAAPAVAAIPEENAGAVEKDVEAAKRLARIIVADIALYNQQKIEVGIRNGSFFSLLKAELEEGKKLYNARASRQVQQKGNFYKNAILDFIKKKKLQQDNA